MTEAEWLACSDPKPMLDFLRGKASRRKLRLFACACCRRIWHQLEDDRFRKAIEMAEQVADGLATEADGRKASRCAMAAVGEWGREPGLLDLNGAARYAGLAAAWAGTPRMEEEAAAMARMAEIEDAQESEMANPQCSDWALEVVANDTWRAGLLHDLFGNPFCPTALDPVWLTRQDGTVLKLAQSIYNDRAFERLPILADALEDGGCKDANILDHCRQPGNHTRGCWILDLVLGKE
jgi:hypothetical protein